MLTLTLWEKNKLKRHYKNGTDVTCCVNLCTTELTAYCSPTKLSSVSMKINALRIQTTGQNVPLSDSERRGREETKRKTVKDQEVSLTQIMHTPFPPQKGNLLGHTDPFSCPWPGGRQCWGAARTLNTWKLTCWPTGRLRLHTYQS